MSRGFWREYVPVGVKLAQARRYAAAVAKKQRRQPSPVAVSGRKMATTFWGQAWCDNLDAYSDYSNRLPRGATYVRNGSVVDLVIKPRRIEAIVAGSEPYKVKIEIAALARPRWSKIKRDCSKSIDSLLDLLAGRLSDGVMRRLTCPKQGMFPAPREIKMSCSCPDWSDCCKHLAAVMYGIGARLDSEPELLFLLREVDQLELASSAVQRENLDRQLRGGGGQLAGQDLSAVFGIELDEGSSGRKPRSNSGVKAAGGSKQNGATKARSPRANGKKAATRKTATVSRAAKADAGRRANSGRTKPQAVSPKRSQPPRGKAKSVSRRRAQKSAK